MSENVEYRVDQANAFQISQHLRGCDTYFIQTLNNRVSIDDYSKKIAEKAVRFEAWVEDALVGLVAMYCNDQERHFAYITSVSMSREWQAKGIASVLMRQCIKHAVELGGVQIGLEVRQENTVAVNFYRRFGFAMDDAKGSVTRMTLKLEARKP